MAVIKNMDKEFLISLKRGDERSFQRLYQIYADKIYRFGYNFKRDEEFAENLVQETFIKVFQNIKSFKDNKDLKNPLKSWIYKIAKNHAFNELKKSRRELLVMTEEQSYEKIPINSSKKDINEKVIQKEQLKRVYDQLDNLSFKKKTTFILFFIEELTADEIAVIMKENRGSTLKRLQRLKEELQQSLNKEEV